MPQPPSQADLYRPRIVAEWAQLAVGPPWSDLSERERIDFLPPLVDGMLRGSIDDPPSGAAREQAVRAAAKHGAERRAQGFTEQHLLLEYYLVRVGLWSASRGGAPAFGLSALALARADALISVLVLATLRGYRKDRLEVDGRWLEALDELFADC